MKLHRQIVVPRNSTDVCASPSTSCLGVCESHARALASDVRRFRSHFKRTSKVSSMRDPPACVIPYADAHTRTGRQRGAARGRKNAGGSIGQQLAVTLLKKPHVSAASSVNNTRGASWKINGTPGLSGESERLSGMSYLI